MRQSRRDGVRDISETHVNHHGRKGVKERNRVEEGERRTEDRRECRVEKPLTRRETADGFHSVCPLHQTPVPYLH